MMPDASAPKPEPLPEAEAGFAYFTTPAHYQSVAGRVLAALAGGGRFVLLTGNPPPNGRLLSNALSKAASGSHTVIGVPCGRGLTRDDWRRLVPSPSGEIEVQEFSAAALLVALGSPLPLYVLEDADQLSDEQLREFFATWLFGEPTIGMAVLAVTPAFLGRLERPALAFLIEGLAARILFQHLGPDEISAFIRQQFRAGEVDKAFNADAITSIAAASGGDPTLVNRLAFRALEPHRTLSTPLAQRLTPRTASAPQPAQPTPPPDEPAGTMQDLSTEEKSPAMTVPAFQPSEDNATMPPVRRPSTLRRRLVIGGIFVVAYFGILLVLGTLIPRHLRPTAKSPTVEASQTAPSSTQDPDAVSRGPIPTPRSASAPMADTAQNSPTVSPRLEPSGDLPHIPPPVADTPRLPAKSEIASSDASETARRAPAPGLPSDSSKGIVEGAAAVLTRERSPSASASLAPPTTITPAAPSAPPSASSAPSEDIASLIARGDALLSTGDIVSARLYYERAANAGNGHAAMLMAETFDPAFLDRAGVRGVRGDAAQAAIWYQRARDLGDREAARRFELLQKK